MERNVARRTDPSEESEPVDPARPARDLLVFGEDWGGLPSSTQHLMRHLSRDRSIVWINSIGMRRPRLSYTDLRRTAIKLGSALRPVLQRSSHPRAPDNIHVLAPLAVSWPGNKAVDRLNAQLLGRQVGATLRARAMHDPIVWASLPNAVIALDAIKANKVVYYCGDDYAALPHVDPEIIRELEQRIVNRADVVVAASEFLFQRLPAGKTVYLPHGVDIDLFSHPCAPARDLPLGRPVAGYYGSIAAWVDIDMIARAAATLPDWDFVLIGPITTDVSVLTAMPNVRLLGPRPHAQLPSYAQHWTVSLLPFKRTRSIEACNPLKLREYLAAGRPIASISMPALKPYQSLLSVADPERFAEAICRAAVDQGRNAARQASVRHESWAARSERLSQILDRFEP
jgi:glycosyltransferase involved in cell wall biosynthesis